MASDHIRWEFAAADDFNADLQTERAFNSDQNSATDGTYRSLTGQLDGIPSSGTGRPTRFASYTPLRRRWSCARVAAT